MERKTHMNYIIFNDGSVLIFSDNISPQSIKVEGKFPVSGGFCDIAETQNKNNGMISRFVSPYGGLRELEVRSNPIDSKILNKLIFS